MSVLFQWTGGGGLFGIPFLVVYGFACLIGINEVSDAIYEQYYPDTQVSNMDT